MEDSSKPTTPQESTAATIEATPRTTEKHDGPITVDTNPMGGPPRNIEGTAGGATVTGNEISTQTTEDVTPGKRRGRPSKNSTETSEATTSNEPSLTQEEVTAESGGKRKRRPPVRLMNDQAASGSSPNRKKRRRSLPSEAVVAAVVETTDVEDNEEELTPKKKKKAAKKGKKSEAKKAKKAKDKTSKKKSAAAIKKKLEKKKLKKKKKKKSKTRMLSIGVQATEEDILETIEEVECPRKSRRKYVAPKRRTHFNDGTEKPVEYQEVYAKMDRIDFDRLSYVDAVENQKKRVAEMEEALERAKQELLQSQERLKEFDSKVLQPAKEELVEKELSMDFSWTRKYHQLVAYKEKHGDLGSLPGRCPEDKELDSLCIWVNRQRMCRKQFLDGKLQARKPHRFELLDKLGFVWRAKDKWDSHFECLQKFREVHGHCMVPQHYHDRKLANWVDYQRQEMSKLKKEGKCSPNITPDRIERLNQLGFIWNVFDLKWNEMYNKLKKFYEENGHSRVEKRSLPDQKLYDWMQKQRQQYAMYQDENERKKRKCRLTEEKIQKLNDLGFDWTVQDDMDPDPVNHTGLGTVVTTNNTNNSNSNANNNNDMSANHVGAEGIEYMYQYDPFSV